MDLYPYQIRAANWLLNKKRAIIGSEVGTGKTPVAIHAAMMLRAKRVGGPTVVICPSLLKGMWQREILKWVQDAKVQVVKTGKDRIQPDAEWVIFSYELFKKFTFATPPLVVIIDEFHYCKSPRAERTQAVFGKESIVRKAERVWLLSGTPFPNNLIDCWVPFSFCSYYRLGKYWEFAEKYCYVKDTLWGKQAKGAKNVKDLASKTKPFLLRDTVEGVLSELPGFQETIVPLEPTAESLAVCTDLAIYLDAVKEAIAENNTSELNKIPNMSEMRRKLGLAKVPQAIEFVSELLLQGLPIVVFAHHQKVIADLVGGLSKYVPLSKIGVIVGDTPSARRTELVADFQEGNIDCLVLSIKAAAIGITLTRSRIAVFVETDWTPAVMEQAQARIRRLGQKSFCTYYYLYFPESLDEVVHRSVAAKQQGIDKFWKTWESGVEPVEESEQINWD